MNMRLGPAILSMLVAVTGCATSRVDWDFDPAVEFTDYRTFDWLTPPGTVTDQRERFPLLALRLKRAFEHELRAIGYDKVNEDPDFYVAFHTAVGQTLTRTYFTSWSYRFTSRRHPRWRTGLVIVDDYEVGSLVFDVIDAATDELAWRGVASGFPFRDGTPDRGEAETTARAILEGFPP